MSARAILLAGLTLLLIVLAAGLYLHTQVVPSSRASGSARWAALAAPSSPESSAEARQLWGHYHQITHDLEQLRLHGRFDHQSLRDPPVGFRGSFSLAFLEPNLVYVQVSTAEGDPVRRLLGDGHSVYLEEVSLGTIFRWKTPTTDAGWANLLADVFPYLDHPLQPFRLRAVSPPERLEPETLVLSSAAVSADPALAQTTVLSVKLPGEPQTQAWFEKDPPWPLRVALEQDLWSWSPKLYYGPQLQTGGVHPVKFSLRQSLSPTENLSPRLFSRDELSSVPVVDVPDLEAARREMDRLRLPG